MIQNMINLSFKSKCLYLLYFYNYLEILNKVKARNFAKNKEKEEVHSTVS